MEFNWTAMVYIVSCWLIIAEGWTLISTEFMFFYFFKEHISTSIWQLTWSSSSTFLQILTAPCVTNTHNTSLSIAICFPVCTWFDWMILNDEMNVASEFECLIDCDSQIWMGLGRDGAGLIFINYIMSQLVHVMFKCMFECFNNIL